MDVFHKVLVKIYEEAGGKETEDVDLTSLLKREGFYSNIDTITKQLEDEGWVTQTARQYVVRITHWGRKEAQRVLSDSPDKANERERELSRMVNEAKEVLIAIEELSGKPTIAKLDNIDQQLASLVKRSKKIRDLIA